MNLKDCLTVSEVAKRICLTEERVRELINLKQIKAVKIGRWYVHPKDLEEFIQSRRNV
jgi:excisionase family DNA binding protein